MSSSEEESNQRGKVFRLAEHFENLLLAVPGAQTNVTDFAGHGTFRRELTNQKTKLFTVQISALSISFYV